jgi:GLPGLI family protein
MNSWLRYLLCVFLFFGISNSFAQSKKGMQVVYDMTLEFSKYPYYEAKLLFNATSALFTYQSKQKEPVNTQDFTGNTSIVLKDPNKYLLYHHLDGDTIYQLQSGIKKWGRYDRKETIEWKFVKDTTKQIDRFICKMAKTKFKGRNYIVWYTESIPVPLGPWKLTGLPGLILSASDDHGMVKFEVRRIKNYHKELPNVPLDSFKWIQKHKYDSLRLSVLKNKMARLFSKGDRSDAITFTVKLDEQIER